MRHVTVRLTEAERDAVLAALAHWRSGLPLRDPIVLEIATNAGKHEPLGDTDLEALSDRINNLDDEE